MSIGPAPMSHSERLALAREIADRALAMHTDNLTAVGIYGSTARGTDGLYSDLEMLCVLGSDDDDYSYEWSIGAWKAEVNFLSENVLLHEATAVDERWPLTHGSFVTIHSLYDPHQFFARLRKAVESVPEEAFVQAIRGTIVGELYEWIGKLRNAEATAKMAHITELAVSLAKHGAYIIGLQNRRLYTSGSTVLAESLTLPGRPVGYDELCSMVINGDLSDKVNVIQTCERFWRGVVDWAVERNINFIETRRIPF